MVFFMLINIDPGSQGVGSDNLDLWIPYKNSFALQVGPGFRSKVSSN